MLEVENEGIACNQFITMRLLKAIWLFCSYLFVPQWGKNKANTNLTVKKNMIIDKKILDELTEKAKASPRLRCNLDLRNSADDQSQRMLNALELGTIMPIHRHKGSSETCVCIRGHFEEYFYDEKGVLTDTIDTMYFRYRQIPLSLIGLPLFNVIIIFFI